MLKKTLNILYSKKQKSDKKQPILRVCGDVHGCISQRHPTKNVSYLDLIEDCQYSVQLGDMGFNYSDLKGVGINHQFILGNHENYDNIPNNHALCDFGPVSLGPFQFFYVRGAWSIDAKRRNDLMKLGYQKMWWWEEQLSSFEMGECLQCYKNIKPNVVMSHTCPAHISEQVGSPGIWKAFGHDGPKISDTQLLLEEMYKVHEPKLWLFGHFHRNHILVSGKTTFMCIDELNYIDFNENWEIV